VLRRSSFPASEVCLGFILRGDFDMFCRYQSSGDACSFHVFSRSPINSGDNTAFALDLYQKLKTNRVIYFLALQYFHFTGDDLCGSPGRTEDEMPKCFILTLAKPISPEAFGELRRASKVSNGEPALHWWPPIRFGARQLSIHRTVFGRDPQIFRRGGATVLSSAIQPRLPPMK